MDSIAKGLIWVTVYALVLAFCLGFAAAMITGQHWLWVRAGASRDEVSEGLWRRQRSWVPTLVKRVIPSLLIVAVASFVVAVVVEML